MKDVVYCRYKEEYNDDIKRVVSCFVEEYLSPFVFNPEQIDKQIEACKDTSVYLVIDDVVCGIAAGFVVSNIIDGSLVMQEYIWYIMPEHRRYGIRLLKEFEEMCKSIGINKIFIAHMNNDKADKIARLYERVGYKVFEIQYMKEI